MLVHEVADAQTNPQAARRHTTPEQAGGLFTRVKPWRLLSLRPSGPETIRHIQGRVNSKGFDGFDQRITAPLEGGDRIGAIRAVLFGYDHLTPVFDEDVPRRLVLFT